MAKKERTTSDVYDLLTHFAEKSEKLFGLLNERLSGVTKEVKDLKVAVGHIEHDVLSIKEDMGSVTGAIYSNVETIKNHERRIVRLERSR